MSLTDKLKSTTNSLIQKYAGTTWANVLSQQFFESAEFQNILKTLMEQFGAGHKFTPTFPSLFKSFDLCSLEGVRVVFVNAYPSDKSIYNDGLALSFSGEGQDYSLATRNFHDKLKKARTPQSENHTTDLSYLAKQGVMLLNFSMTCPEGSQKDHLELWRPAFQKLITDIAYKTVGTVFVFIGSETEYLHKAVRKGQYKLFLPNIGGNPNWETDDVFTKINTILEKQKKHPINW